MPAISVESKLRTQAQTFAGLTALIGAPGDSFRWFDVQFIQGKALPAITAQRISSVPYYSLTSRNALDKIRMQFVIWDTDPERGRAVQVQLALFLDVFNATNLPSNAPGYPNYVANIFTGMEPQTQPPVYKIVVDAMIFNNETL